MPTVYNITRQQAEYWPSKVDESYVWITIQEPGQDHIHSHKLSKLKTLKIKFWDCIKPLPNLRGDEDCKIFYPPTKEDAKQILDFILDNKGKNIIVNCKAGKCRSGAIAQFCVDYLGYEWDAESKKRAHPNILVYSMLSELYGHPKKPIVNDKRRITP